MKAPVRFSVPVPLSSIGLTRPPQNKCYLRATIALCESLGDSGIPVEFYKEDGYFLFGINGENGWTDCLRTKSIREVWEWVSELRKEGE